MNKNTLASLSKGVMILVPQGLPLRLCQEAGDGLSCSTIDSVQGGDVPAQLSGQGQAHAPAHDSNARVM